MKIKSDRENRKIAPMPSPGSVEIIDDLGGRKPWRWLERLKRLIFGQSKSKEGQDG